MPMNRNDYPADWERRSRFVRFARADNRCEWCGAQNRRPHPVTGSSVVLTTAHVYDRDPMAAQLLNLAALCQRCHLRHDRTKPKGVAYYLDRRLRRAIRRAGIDAQPVMVDCWAWNTIPPVLLSELRPGKNEIFLRLDRTGGQTIGDPKP